MTKHRNLDYGDRFPEAVGDALMEFISSYAGPNFKVTQANSTTLQIVAGADNDQVAVAINGRWRYIAATINASHPGGGAATYDVYVTGSDNVFTPTGNPPGLPPETDTTVYAFALAIRAAGSPPATALYRKIGTCAWDGAAITDYAITVGPSRHHQTHEPGGLDPISPTLIAAASMLVGTLASRPAASAANNGFTYLATDVNGGTLYRSNGSSWVQMAAGVTHQATHLPGGTDALPWSASIHASGTLAARPAAAAGNAGFLYTATDVNGGTTYRSDGATWTKIALGATESPSMTSISSSILLYGTLASRPTAAAGNANFLFFATDVNGGTLYQSNASSWVKIALGLAEAVALLVNTQAGAYTLVLGDAGKVVEINSAVGVNVTVPTNASVAFPIGTVITIVQIGAGLVTVVAGGGVTLRTNPGPKLGGQYAMASLYKRGTDEWVLGGNTTP